MKSATHILSRGSLSLVCPPLRVNHPRVPANWEQSRGVPSGGLYGLHPLVSRSCYGKGNFVLRREKKRRLLRTSDTPGPEPGAPSLVTS